MPSSATDTEKLEDFCLLAPGVGAGMPAPAGWQPLACRPLLILVGVTGAGKTTTLRALQAAEPRFQVLPERREVTDRLIIDRYRRVSGAAGATPGRLERFAITRRFRAEHPGGMGELLAQFMVDSCTGAWLLFDGLRGANEVEAAAARLPQAVFLALETPDWQRVRRLATRADPFDRRGSRPVPAAVAESLVALGVPEAAGVFSEAEEQALLALLRQGQATAEDLRNAVRIVLEERQNYDPQATVAALLGIAPERTLVIDTTTCPPAQVARAALRRFGTDLRKFDVAS